MKTIKKFLKIILVLLILILLGGWIYTLSLHPKYDGEVKLENISEEVKIYFDEIGVPHINAENQHDAYVALGYVHAQDRLWQMELIRRITAGRLSEIFGRRALEVDLLFSGLGVEEESIKPIESLDKNSPNYKMAIAYLDGINQYIENGKTPIEFTLIGVKKEKYTLKDMYNVFGYMAFSFAAAHKTDPLLNEVKEKLGEDYLNELLGSESENLTFIRNAKNPVLTAAFSKAMNTIYEELPIAPLIGSNSWVIGPEKTKNGRVIFANDPHIGFSQPSVWYQAHVKTPDYEMYGFHIALMPFPLLGHNRDYAYGLTMLANDDIDFYTEENNPENENEYKTPFGFEKYKILEKRIKIKDEKDTVYQIKVSNHGPILNGLITHLKDEKPIAMQWIFTKEKNETLDVLYRMSHSENLSDFKIAASKLHAPGLNMMYGDAKNNIAWFAAGKLYKYRDSLSTKTFLNGTSGRDEILEYLDFAQNPQAVNPSWNYVYSANNQPDSIAGMLYSGYYQPEDRAKRIVNLLESKNDWTKQDVAEMLYDVTSPTVSEVATNLLKSVNDSQFSASEKIAMTKLENWNGVFEANEIGPVIYNRFIYEVLVNIYKDEMGDGFEQFINTTIQDKVLRVLASKENSIWLDDISTSNVENKEEIITKSFKSAITFLENQLGENVENWMWKRVISVEYNHAFDKSKQLRSYFNVGPFETIGGDQVINNQIYKLDSTGYYKVTAGPSTRRVVDFSDVENSLGIIPTGQSGNVFSDYYKDQAQKYLDGDFEKMKLNQTEIELSKNVLVLKPKNN